MSFLRVNGFGSIKKTCKHAHVRSLEKVVSYMVCVKLYHKRSLRQEDMQKDESIFSVAFMIAYDT